MLIYTGYMVLENFQFVEKEQVLNKLKWLIITQYKGESTTGIIDVLEKLSKFVFC